MGLYLKVLIDYYLWYLFLSHTQKGFNLLIVFIFIWCNICIVCSRAKIFSTGVKCERPFKILNNQFVSVFSRPWSSNELRRTRNIFGSQWYWQSTPTYKSQWSCRPRRFRPKGSQRQGGCPQLTFMPSLLGLCFTVSSTQGKYHKIWNTEPCLQIRKSGRGL